MVSALVRSAGMLKLYPAFDLTIRGIDEQLNVCTVFVEGVERGASACQSAFLDLVTLRFDFCFQRL